MTTLNPFGHKSVEKVLLAQFLPSSPNKRWTRKYMRRFARHIEHAFEIGMKDGKAGNRLIGLDELMQEDESATMRVIGRYAYTAYKRGFETGSKAV